MFTVTCNFTERQLRTAVRRVVFPKGRIRCPRCCSFRIKKVPSEERYHCPKCRRKFSLLSHTWLKDCKLPLTTLLLLLHAWQMEYTITHTQELVHLSVPSIRRYFSLFRVHIVKTVPFVAENDVQVDEAYFGQFKKQANYLHGFRTYKVVEKVCVAGISCPSNGQLTAMVVRSDAGNTIRNFIREHVPTNIRVYSDSSPIYTRLRETHDHWPQTHDLGFHHAYYIESCWSWMKRKLFRQYHHFWRKNAESYVSELTWRFNTRNKQENALTYLLLSL